MDVQDLREMNWIGAALWADGEQSSQRAFEAMAAVVSLGTPEERVIERAGMALLERVHREGGWTQGEALQNPFFRIETSGRFLLVALHRCRWSYHRCSRILAVSEEQVAERAWAARVQLSGQWIAGHSPMGAGRHCPEFHPRRPWVQAFLDDELSVRTRLYLQNHMMACDACRGLLHQARRIFQATEEALPKEVAPSQEAYDQWSQWLKRSSIGLQWNRRSSFLHSLRVFFAKRETWMAVGAAGLLALGWSLRGIQ